MAAKKSPKAETPKAVASNPGEVSENTKTEPTVEKVNGTTIRKF